MFRHFIVQYGLVLFAVAILLLILRVRRAVAGTMILLLLVSLWPIGRGRAVMLPEVRLDSAPANGAVRVVVFNIHPQNDRWKDEVLRALSLQPDVLVLIESSREMWNWIMREAALSTSRLPYLEYREWVGGLTSPCFVLSRWPLHRFSFPEIPESDRDILLAQVECPHGAFTIGVFHPHSPRNEARWRLGNGQLDSALQAVRSRLDSDQEPVVIACDLNAGPGAWRGDRMRASGLRMSKPMLGGWGSFPSSWPGPLRLQIDDIWHSKGVRPAAWTSLESLGSDHRMIITDLRPDP